MLICLAALRPGGGPGPGPLAEATETDATSAEDTTGDDDEDGDDDGVHMERTAKLNDADNAHAFMVLLLGTLKESVEGHFWRLQLLYQSQRQSADSIDFVLECVNLFNVLQVRMEGGGAWCGPGLLSEIIFC